MLQKKTPSDQQTGGEVGERLKSENCGRDISVCNTERLRSLEHIHTNYISHLCRAQPLYCLMYMSIYIFFLNYLEDKCIHTTHTHVESEIPMMFLIKI